jgi:hypothetical protein
MSSTHVNMTRSQVEKLVQNINEKFIGVNCKYSIPSKLLFDGAFEISWDWANNKYVKTHMWESEHDDVVMEYICGFYDGVDCVKKEQK